MNDSRPIIVHIITQLELGGAQQNTLDTCERLARERFRVVLLAGEGGMLDSAAARIPDLDFRLLRHLVRPVAPLTDRRAFREVREHLHQLQSEPGARIVVHTHSSKAGIVGRLAARSAKVAAIVHSIHGFGHPALRNPLLKAFAIRAEQWLAPRTNRFIAVSRANIEEGQRLGLFARTPVELIRSGFELDAFRAAGLTRNEARQRLGLPENAPIVGTVACLKPQKGPLDLPEIARAVLAKHPDAHFVLAGDGELREPLERRIAELGQTDRFHVLGWRDDVPTVLRALDVFLLTSRWEGLPRSVVQAMTSGIPVVANAVDGVPDVVVDGTTGYLIRPGDLDTAAQRVLELLRDPGLATRLNRAAQAKVAEFDVNAMVRAQERIYADVLGSRSE